MLFDLGNLCTFYTVTKATSNAGIAGEWLGRSVIEAGQLLEVKMKDATMTETKLVIELSRHTILLKNRDIYIVPTADISQFHEVALPSQF
jgi:hypothetical protein